MRNDFVGKEVCRRGRIFRASFEAHINPSSNVGHVSRVIRIPPSPSSFPLPPRWALETQRCKLRPAPPDDYKSHPALRSCTLRQSKMADTMATAGAGSSGTVRAGGLGLELKESEHSATFP